jgi:hypothetical protein
MPNITNIIPPRVPLMDPRNGLISREWYLFFLSLFNQTGGSTISLEDVQKGPPTQDLDISALLAQASLNAESSSALLSQYAALSNDVQALALGPADTPQLPRKRYGSFYDTTTQTAAVINTAYGMTFNTTDLSTGVTIGTPTSRVYVDTRSVYNIQFSAQLDKTIIGLGNVWIWLRKNGTNVVNSTGQLQVQSITSETVAAWNYLLDMNAGDYFELMWETDDITTQITSFAATAVHPATPSIILTVTDNISS